MERPVTVAHTSEVAWAIPENKKPLQLRELKGLVHIVRL
jgi:hypothetical protein